MIGVAREGRVGDVPCGAVFDGEQVGCSFHLLGMGGSGRLVTCRGSRLDSPSCQSLNSLIATGRPVLCGRMLSITLVT